MEILSLGRLSSGFLLWQSRPNAWGLTVACKATFHLHPGEATLATEQEPLNEEDNYWDDNAARSVRAPCDLVPFKPFVDVVLVGSAYAPKLAPVRSLVASLAVSDISKSVEVFCDRAMMPDGTIQEGSGFARMALLYERAAGGPGSWNPVGVRADARDAYGRTILPNLQKPGVRPSPSTPLEPLAFGPVAPVWPTRLEKLGRQAHGASPYLFRDQPLPQGMDPVHFNAAPPDQQMTALREGDGIRLEHLHPDHAQLRTDIPALRPAVFLRASDRAAQRLAMRMDTLWIDTDQKIFTITWRGQLALGRRDEWSQAVITLETGPQTLTWNDLEPYVHKARPGAADGRAAPNPPQATGRHPHEGTVTDSISPISVTEAPQTPRSRADEPSRPSVNAPASQRQAMEPPPSSALPFRPPPPSRPTVTISSEGPMPRKGQDAALPFTSAPRNPNAPLRSAPAEGLTARSDSVLPFTPKPPAAAPAVPPAPAPPPALPVPESPWASGIASVAPASSAASSPAESAMPSAFSDSAPLAGAAFTGGAAFSGAGGAIAASNAAAAAQPAWLPSDASKPAPAAAPAPIVPAPRSSRVEPPSVIQLIWYHEPSVARIRRSSEWKPILKELERKPRDKDLDDPALAQDPMEMEEKREVFEVLTHASPKAYELVQQAYLDAIREDGKFVPPLILVTGELTFPFDELETLKATLTTVSPLVTPNDENLRACVDSAKEFLKTPGLSSAPAVSEGLTTRIKEAFGQGRRNVPAGYVDTQTERVLLEQRHYQKRAVLGERHLRALLPMSGSTTPVPVYIPEAVSEKLPMYQRVRARLIVEVHQQEDQHETHSLALRALALSRLSPPPRRS